MTDPLAVPRDESARVEDAFLMAMVRAIAVGARDGVPMPPPGDYWVKRAVSHGVLMPVIGALRGAGYDVSPELARFRTHVAVGALTVKRDLSSIAEAFSARGVVWAVVKGPVLSDVVYQRRGTRESADLDVLVAPHQLRLAVEVLRGQGARLLGVDWSQRTWATGAEVPLITPSATVVDLHWHLLNRPAMRRAYGLSMDSMLERRAVRDLDGIQVPTLDDLDLVLHVLLHGCLDGSGRLRALLDAQQCISWLESKGWMPDDLAERAEARGLSSPSWLVLAMTADLVDPRLSVWHDAIASPSLWARGVVRLSRRKHGDALTNGFTRRLTRYIAPRSTTSVQGVAGYAFSRIVRLVRADRTEVSGEALDQDPDFERFLDRAGSMPASPSGQL